MADADAMIDLMRYASQAKVAVALGVSKTTTGDWAKGRGVTPFRLRQVRDLLRPETVDAPPMWVERLLAGMMMLEDRADVSDVELARTQAKVAAYLTATARRQPPPRAASAGAETDA